MSNRLISIHKRHLRIHINAYKLQDPAQVYLPFSYEVAQPIFT